MIEPKRFTFDLFGTVLDWRSGLVAALEPEDVLGRRISDEEFDRVIDVQARLEGQAFRPYREIVAESLIEVLGLSRSAAEKVGLEAGTWPLYPDSKAALVRLMGVAPCIAITNSDLCHRGQIEAQLGFAMSDWICAEQIGVYKPSPEVWKKAGVILRAPFAPEWWHVSAYGDYDLEAAAALGLFGVMVDRPHARTGPHRLRVPSLTALADRLCSS